MMQLISRSVSYFEVLVQDVFFKIAFLTKRFFANVAHKAGTFLAVVNSYDMSFKTSFCRKTFLTMETGDSA